MIQKYFQMEMLHLITQVCDGPKVISNGRVEFDDTQNYFLFKDPKVNPNRDVDFDHPKVYGDTSIFNGLVVFIMNERSTFSEMFNSS